MDEALFQQLLKTPHPSPATGQDQAASAPPTGQIPDALFRQLLEASSSPPAEPSNSGAAPTAAAAAPTPPPIPTPQDLPQATPQEPQAPVDLYGADLTSMAGSPPGILDAALGGAARAIFETKDFVTGATPKDQQSEVRQRLEDNTVAATSGSFVNSAVSTISQFATGMLGAGKIVGAIKLAREAAALAPKIAGMAKGAATMAVAFDPHQERLSNLAEQVPIIGEPLFGWLAAHPDDSEAWGRTKAALEGIGLDAALIGTFKAATMAYKAMRGGTEAELHAATEELQKVHPGAEAAHPVETPAEAPTVATGEVKPGEAVL
jgi:hypothetical protein